MKQPTLDGLAVSEMLYGSERKQQADSKVVNPQTNSKRDPLRQPPTILPDDPAEAWKKGYKTCEREHSGNLEYRMHLLEVFHQYVYARRKELIKKGEVKPQDEQEREWAKNNKRWRK